MNDIFPAHWARKIVPFVLWAMVVYAALFFYGDGAAAMHTLGQLSAGIVVSCWLLTVLSFLVRGARWIFYLRVMGIAVPWHSALLVYFCGFVMSITPGKIGEVLKCVQLKSTHDVPVAQTAPAVVAERFTDLVGLLLLGAVGLWQVPGQHLASVVTFLFSCVLLALAGAHRLVGFFVERLARFRWLAHRSGNVFTAFNSLVAVTRPYPLAAGSALSVLSWGIQALSIWLLARYFPATGISVTDAMVAQSFPLIAGALVLLPGGMGATEASMTGVLQKLGGPGMTSVVAVALTICIRLLTFWFAMLLGLISLALWQRGRQPVHGRAVLDRS
jgi:uncharacterized protein (TIRG00374 family)